MRKTGLLLLALACGAAQTPELTSEQVVALARTFFRDTGELPMNVRVTKVVTDAGGKLKRSSESSVRVLGRGYNQTSDMASWRVDSGWFSTQAMRWASGNLALTWSMMRLASKAGGAPRLEIQQPAWPGEPFLVTVEDADCPTFKLYPPGLFPLGRLCGSWRYALQGNLPNDLVFDRFSFDAMNLPAAAKVSEFGDVQVLSFRCEGDFRKAYLPGDAQPYLLPNQVVTTVDTSKGKIAITAIRRERRKRRPGADRKLEVRATFSQPRGVDRQSA
jgi:hypothetical protein